jgi:hypothetical protein
MSVRLFDRDYVEKQLLDRKCHKIKDFPHGTTALWMTASGWAFAVPQEPDGKTDEYSLKAILIDIANH